MHRGGASATVGAAMNGLPAWLLSLGLIVASSAANLRAAAPSRPWNVVLILVDDLGWTDLGCMGSRFYETPNIDQLAADGMKFTAAYAACTVCSPTRAAVLTGQYPARLHLTNWIPGHKYPKARLRAPDWTMHLPLATANLGRVFHDHGYATVSIGKWHLGGPEYYPDKQGFDENIGGTSRGSPPSYLAPWRIPTLTEGRPGEFLTDRESAEACRFIERHRDCPFFVYLPHYAVHTPHAGKPEVVAKYRAKAERAEAAGALGRHRNPTYAALIESVDDSVGRIRAKLRELGLAERTVILFTSDNGGLIGRGRRPITFNDPLRAGKGSPYEGGVRVPLIVHWPGVTRPGSVCDVPVISVDFFPTLLEIAGAPAPRGHVVDGVSLTPLLKGAGRPARDALFWHFPHYHPGGATPYGAIRLGGWRLIEFYEDHHVELYNLAEDLGETRNLAAARPEKARQMRGMLAAWRQAVGAQMPTLNPAFDPGSTVRR